MSDTLEAPAPAAWQKGYDLGLLRSYAAVFRARHKPLVYGAFGLVKERDIADALADRALLWVRRPGGEPSACAIGKALKNAGHMTDVAGREITVPAGHVKLSAFACLNTESGAALLRSMVQRWPGKVWVEAFEEDTVGREALAAVPQLRYIATKIAAGSEVKGIYTDATVLLPALHPAEAASVLVVRPGFAGADERAAMLDEADRFAKWAQHYSSYNKRKSWTAFALRGYAPRDPTFIIKPAEMAKSWQEENRHMLSARPDWTAAVEHFPATMQVVRRVLGGREADRVRLMRLAPKGELSRHADITDREAGLADGRLCRLHLPLRTSDAVIVHGWGKRGEHVTTRFPAGALCYLDQRGPHSVENRDPSLDRIHLVLDVRSDAALRDMIAEAL